MVILSSDDTTMLLLYKECTHIGVIINNFASGFAIGPPADRLYPVVPVGVETIKPSGIRKFFDIVSEMKDAISLGVGEPDFDTPWHIRDEGIYALSKGRTFYTSNAGLKELRYEISNYLKR